MWMILIVLIPQVGVAALWKETDGGGGVVVMGLGVRGAVCNERGLANTPPTIVQQQHNTTQHSSWSMWRFMVVATAAWGSGRRRR